ncbi:hypothetical protein [Streptomyces sp. NPDC089919]|uniref:hypothetical protein n=1 Tax=Streptomyces sp. NPDC089919 TaxID=3155188 RepID=UPI00343AE223
MHDRRTGTGRTGTRTCIRTGTSTGRGTDSGRGTGARRGTRTAVTAGALLLLLGTTGSPGAAAAPTYAVKLQVTHAPVTPQIRVWDRTTWKAYDVPVADGTDGGTATLPTGSYLTLAAATDWGSEARFLARTFTVGSAATTVTLDADLAEPAGITVDDTTAARTTADVSFTLPDGQQVAFDGNWGPKVYVTPIALPGLSLDLHDVLTKKGSGPNRPSPYRYDLVHRFHDGSPATPVVSVLTADLARRTTSVRAQGAGLSANLWTAARTPEDQSGVYQAAPVPVGGSFTQYLTPGTTLDRYLEYGSHSLDLPGLDLPKGDGGSEYVGRAPFTTKHSQFPSSGYAGGKFTLGETAPLSDAYGNEGRDTAGQTVYQVTGDASVLGTSGALNPYDTYTVAAGSHTVYKISHTVTRAGAQSRLTSRVSTDWTFPRTALPGAGAGSGELPVLDPKLSVAGLDSRGRTAAGTVTVTASLVPRTAGTVPTLTKVEYSTDDGASWKTAGTTGSVAVAVPAGAAFVSLRVTGKDDKGGTVVQTVLRAFGGPAAETALKIGATAVTGVSVNGGSSLVPNLTGLRTYSVAFTATDPSGISAAGLYLYHGGYDKPDGIIPIPPADCAKHGGSSTTYDCTADFNLSGRGHLGLTKLAGTWSVAGWALAGDHKSLYSGPVTGTALIKRSSSMTADATPEPVTAGGTLTVTGTLTGSAWEYGAATALTGRTVQLQFRKAGTTAWTTVGTGTTDAAGKAVVTHTATATGAWRFTYPGSTGTAPCTSPTDTVTVH